MGTLLYLVIFTSLLPFVELISWPEHGCRIELDVSKCWFNVYCVNKLDFGMAEFRTDIDGQYSFRIGYQHNYYKYCNNNFVSKNQYAKINMYYKNNDVDIFVPIYNNNNEYCVDIPMIISLNLTNNEYTTIPELCCMENLIYLNLSHNKLITGNLYNTNKLKSLGELDLSYNEISNLNLKGEYKYTNLTKLILSHNALAELRDGVLDDLKKLTTLDISYNYLKKLKMSTFEGIKNLIYLDLSNNKITEIRYSLFRFTNLKVLDLSHNYIKHIQTSDFIQLKQLEILNLSYNFITSIERTFINAMINLMSFNVRRNMLEAIDEVLFLNNTSLQKVDLAENKLKKIPKDLLRNKKISVFYVTGNRLEGPLVRGMFEGLSLVSVLDLSYQSLTSVNDYTYFGLEKLEHLSLNNNNIGSLSTKSFKTLSKLCNLDLSNNYIEDINFEKDDLISLRMLLLRNNSLRHIKQEYFSHLNALQYLDLAENKITELSSHVFKSLQDLIHLEIWNNPLSGAINEGTLEGLSSLPTLDVSSTQLTNIKNNSFNGMIQLKFLNVSHSKITELEYNSFLNADAIELIDLSYNEIQILNLNASHLQNLTMLLLNNNKLKVINSNNFKGLFKLRAINLASNNIEVIFNNAFYDQNYLTHLDLSSNLKLKFSMSLIETCRNLVTLNLSVIQTEIVFREMVYTPLKVLELSNCGISNITSLNLKALSLLENIVLSSNEIQIIKESAFAKVNNLKTIDLSFNKIKIIPPGIFRDNPLLVSLNISHNALSTVSYGVFRNLFNLEFLDISHNSITDIKSEHFFELPNLKELILDSNKIESINAELFNGTNLAKLSIGDNPLPCETVLRYLNKTKLTFVITTINHIEYNEENHYGITCNKKHMDYIPMSKKDYNMSSENTKILNDIKEILIKIATEKNTQEHVMANNDANKPMISNIHQFGLKYEEKLWQLANFSFAITKELNYTNILLQKMLKLVTVAHSLNVQTTAIPFTKDNATFENLVPYINKMKQDFEDIIASEKQGILNDFETKLAGINSHVDSLLSTISPITEKSNDKNQSPSMFMETCVALILIILACYILLQLYKSKLCVRSRMSYSTRELPGSMESPNL